MRLKAPVPRALCATDVRRDDAAPDIERAAAHLDAAVGRHIQQQTAGPADLRAWRTTRLAGKARPCACSQPPGWRRPSRWRPRPRRRRPWRNSAPRPPAGRLRPLASSKANRYVVLRPRLLSCQRCYELSGSARRTASTLRSGTSNWSAPYRSRWDRPAGHPRSGRPGWRSRRGPAPARPTPFGQGAVKVRHRPAPSPAPRPP